MTKQKQDCYIRYNTISCIGECNICESKTKTKTNKAYDKMHKKSVNTQNTSLKHRILPLKDEKSLERE
jgi:hypothetical protein